MRLYKITLCAALVVMSSRKEQQADPELVGIHISWRAS